MILGFFGVTTLFIGLDLVEWHRRKQEPDLLIFSDRSSIEPYEAMLWLDRDFGITFLPLCCFIFIPFLLLLLVIFVVASLIVVLFEGLVVLLFGELESTVVVLLVVVGTEMDLGLVGLLMSLW